MPSITVKRIIIVFSLFIVAIVAVQLFWLNKLYSFEERLFHTNVIKSVRGLFEDLDLSKSENIQLQKLIRKQDENTFVLEIDNVPEKDTLINYLVLEFEDFDVFADCRVGLYDNVSGKYLFQQYIPMAGSGYISESGSALPVLKEDHKYIMIYFPHRRQYILHEMKIWIVSAMLLLLVLVILGSSLVYLYRQKFLNEIQADFIKNITHEFQTPLTTFQLGLDLLSKPTIREQPDKFEKYISVMNVQTEYLRGHLDDLVKVIRTDSAGLKLNKENVSPNSLLMDAVHHLDFLIAEKNAQLEYHLEKTNMEIKGDRANLYLAILNVLANAIKYSPNPYIVITTKSEHKRYFIVIRDNGVGIEKKYFKHLFKKFFRISTGDVHTVKGLGLGLYFVKKIMDHHRGKIVINSAPSAGTEIKLILPIG